MGQPWRGGRPDDLLRQHLVDFVFQMLLLMDWYRVGLLSDRDFISRVNVLLDYFGVAYAVSTKVGPLFLELA